MVDSKNVSGREIIAFVTKIGQCCESTHDLFFKSDAIKTGETVPDIFETENMPWSPAMSTVHLKVLLVQFADGSTWGDRIAAQEIVNQRKQLRAFYDEMYHTYLRDGESGFVAFQNAHTQGTSNTTTWPAARNVLTLRRTKGTASAIEFVEGKIKNAQAHSAIAEF